MNESTEKAEGQPPDPQKRPPDPRPISEEARRIIEGSMLSQDVTVFEEDGDPTPDERTKWGIGIMTPISLLIAAVVALVQKEVLMYGQYDIPAFEAPVKLTGPCVYAFAAAMVSAALFCHFHYFWGQTPKLYDYYKVPKHVALAMLIVSMFAFFILAIEGS